MEFSKALEAMKNGAAVKLPSWKGFWKLEDGRIKMHCKDGKILDLCETEDILYALGNVLSNDWEILDEDVVTEKEPLLAFDSEDFQRYVRERILEMCQNDGFDITLSDVYVVWYSKSLQNHKGLFATTLKDGLYYEATYNGDKRELYIDVYKKQANIAIQLFNKQQLT